jgi:8-oxo-dGTP pyrophosphatase MutT (NUDIX family)
MTTNLIIIKESLLTEISKKKDLNFGAGIIPICKKTGRILMAQRGKKISNPNQWCNFGGGTEEGELPIDTAKREFREESGYKGKILNITPIFTYNGSDYKKGYKFYNFVAFVTEEFKPPILRRKTVDGDVEVQNAGWFSLDEILNFKHGKMLKAVDILFSKKEKEIRKLINKHCKLTYYK